MNKADTDRFDLLSQLGCIVCVRERGIFTPPEIHHINGRTGNGNQETIGLCYFHHREGSDCQEYTSRHPYKARFEIRHGTEAELLEATNKLLGV